MMKKKVTKSFADALLSADAEVDVVPKPKKVKPKPSKSTHTSGSKEKNSQKSIDFSAKLSSKSYAKSSSQERHKSLSGSSKNSNNSNSQNKKQSYHSSSQDKNSNPQNATSDPFSWPFSNEFRKSAGDSDSDSDDLGLTDIRSKSSEQNIVEKTKFVSNRKAGKADKRVAKLLAEEEERQKNAKILQSVDEDLMLYDLQLEDDLKMETEQQEVINISVLPPGIPFLHSLTCHTLYAPEKVSWPFVPEIAGCKRSSGSNPAALTRWLGSLDPSGVRELILSRTLMDSELGIQVVGRLARYLIRYIAAHPHGPPGGEHDHEMVLAAYQLLCYHVSSSSAPGPLLKQILDELPLSLVNLGSNPSKFPPATLACWSIPATLHHNKTPNSASDSIAQMNAIQLLLNVLSNCLGRLANYLIETEVPLSSTSVSEAMLDDLVAWLSLLGQDPAVLCCSLHISVGTALAHTFQLYPNFQAKIQDLTEIIYAPWHPESGSADGDIQSSNESTGGGTKPFPHHTASFVCGTLLADTQRSRQLSSSLAFVSLSACLQCDEYEVLDAVEMSDLVNLLRSRHAFLAQDCDSYTLRSVLLLLDACITHVVLVQPSEQKMRELGHIVEFVQVELPRLSGGGDGGGGTRGGDAEDAEGHVAAIRRSESVLLSTRTRAQLMGLRTALLDRWEKIMHLGGAVYNAAGQRTTVRLQPPASSETPME